MLNLADRSTELNPDFLSEVVLYALSAADVTMVVALVFVLARNIVKLAVERRRGLPFSRFRAKLVLALLGLTIVPSLLVLLVGGELIRSSTERWFSQEIDDVLSSATQIAGDYYGERQAEVSEHARRIARDIPAVFVQSGDVGRSAPGDSVRDPARARRPCGGLSDCARSVRSARCRTGCRGAVAVAAAWLFARLRRSAGHAHCVGCGRR